MKHWFYGVAVAVIVGWLSGTFICEIGSMMGNNMEIQKEHTIDDFFAALKQVETPNGLKRGKNGEIGPYQITEAYWKDSGVQGEYEMCWNEEYSRMVMIRYWKRYSPIPTDNWQEMSLLECKRLARIHNGGPDGWHDDPDWFVRNRGYTLEQAKKKIANTQNYWARVKKEMGK